MIRAAATRTLVPAIRRNLRGAASSVPDPATQASNPIDDVSPNTASNNESPSSSASTSASSSQPQPFEELGISVSRPSASSTESNPDVTGVPATTSLTGRSQALDRFAHVIPFDTHQFYTALETSFEPPVARSLMKATRGLLVDRIRKSFQSALQVKDFDNGAYLFRAALGELRTELTMRTRKETATLRTALTAVRKEVDVLDSKMKEDIASLKHEIQMDMNNRKAESKADAKLAEIAMEDLHHRTIVRIGDLRTDIEQAKWNNTRRGVAIIGTLVMFVILSMELAPKKPPPPSPPPPPPPAPIIVERPLPSVREMEDDPPVAGGSQQR